MPADKLKLRTIWLSDLHLGSRGCSTDEILSFLKITDSETLYLVGDIIDGWKLKRNIYWPQSHWDVIQKILRKARKGCKVIYLPGNHDEFLRDFIGNDFGRITLVDECVHETIDGRKILVLHGDQFDGITKYHKWVAKVGDVSYELLMTVNRWHSKVRKRLGFGHWSLSAYLKHKVKQAANFINNYEQTIADECRHREFVGVVCGHIHKCEIKTIGSIVYMNCGDGVESCTAMAEDFDGNIFSLRMSDLTVIHTYHSDGRIT